MLEDLTIAAAAALLAARELSAVELTSAVLERIRETEPHVHAYCHVDGERALAAAREADTWQHAGALRGIPFAVKDVFATEGMPTQCGSRALAGYVTGADATVVALLRQAGAILLGKHVTHEFVCGQNVPPTRNPWRAGDYPGGSSAGGGVSVAVGSSLFALGTDAGGSVRKPASVTGVVGLKPTHGRISGRGTLRLASAPSLDHVGTFTRTVEDAAIVLQALAGPDHADARSIDVPVDDYTAALTGRITRIRLGVPQTACFGPELDPEVGEVVDAALATLAELGAQLVPVELPSFALALPAAFTIFPVELAAAHRSLLARRAADYEPPTRHLLELGLIVPAAHVEAADRARALVKAELASAFRESRLDALVTPTLPRTSMPLAEMNPAVDVPRYIPYTAPFNLTGQPAVSVPCGLTTAGLPVGLQIVGRPFDEATVLRVAHGYERTTPWHASRPPV